ncbi:type VI secretion system-associated protein TagF [Azospirillum sp. YIM DDC1]|uniref:Type VI secretion system-associated protein TagF n=1 Tax=Azospirillum aestuarii TaxID=2802052 RepID=A0ABS1HXH4_9PROT|nr:type VI secretion system-associated protein TagF [Azospirillum aestuarii]MBK3778405.1 type VI secretion system-associated protein TagF [Azospirillum brasilense]MBK4719404.1 type VI secretion system-associated protein TagF [Azospirillum aestuarii]TWA90898.1 type VI secretion system protein ImpM [Azospirillum brasilense]
MSPGFAVGFHGKVPARGDFVGYGLPRGVLLPWDAWLTEVLEAAVRQLGSPWERLFQSAPVWRFALSPGLCGEPPLAGIMMPSADRVGRQYPFTIVGTLPYGTDLAVVPVACLHWFTRAESIAADACRAGADVDALPARMAILGRPEPNGADPTVATVVEERVGPLPPRASLWWSRGGGRVPPSVLTCCGLPRSTRAAAFIDGAWERRGWDDLDG